MWGQVLAFACVVKDIQSLKYVHTFFSLVIKSGYKDTHIEACPLLRTSASQYPQSYKEPG